MALLWKCDKHMSCLTWPPTGSLHVSRQTGHFGLAFASDGCCVKMLAGQEGQGHGNRLGLFHLCNLPTPSPLSLPRLPVPLPAPAHLLLTLSLLPTTYLSLHVAIPPMPVYQPVPCACACCTMPAGCLALPHRQTVLLSPALAFPTAPTPHCPCPTWPGSCLLSRLHLFVCITSLLQLLHLVA